MKEEPEIDNLKRIAAETRLLVIRMSHAARTAHLGSSLSCIDILTALYGSILRIDPANSADPNRDRCILSKGHAVSALYACLAKHGFFPEELLREFNEDGSSLPEQPSPGCVPGLEWATGSLGHGLPVALGMALAARIKGQGYHCFAVLSDGECEEGSVWEAAMMAAKQGAENLVAVIDYNKLQATGRVNEIMQVEPLREKWESFGWHAAEVDGHDLEALTASLRAAVENKGAPSAIIAHTIKGKGVSFMEDDNNWHYRSPSGEEVEAAKAELGLA